MEINLPKNIKGNKFESLPSYYFASHIINKIHFQNFVYEKELNLTSDIEGWKYFISSLIEEYLENEGYYLDLKFRSNLFYFEQLGAKQ